MRVRRQGVGMRVWGLVLWGLAGASMVQAQEASAPSPSARAAGYVVVAVADVPLRQVMAGRVVSPNATQIRPRVSGAITEILHEPGQLVRAGTPLFAIDDVSYRTEVARAQAGLARAKAEQAAASAAFERVTALRSSSAASQAAFELAQAAQAKAEADFHEATAALTLAEAALEWTTIRAPITGVLGVAQVAVGDLVTQNQAAALTEIVQIDPLYIDLSEPFGARLALEERARAQAVVLSAPRLAVLSQRGEKIASEGRLLAEGARVSTSTGTRPLRFEVPNADGLLAPGMFVKAEVTYGTEKAALVPQRAAQRERDGRLSAWVIEDGRAVKRVLRESGTFGPNWVIEEGLAAGDQLLIDGLTNLREGTAIAPVLVTLDASGVVVDVPVAGDLSAGEP